MKNAWTDILAQAVGSLRRRASVHNPLFTVKRVRHENAGVARALPLVVHGRHKQSAFQHDTQSLHATLIAPSWTEDRHLTGT